MIHKQSWIPAIILLGVMKTVNVQFAMPMPMFQPQPPPLFMMAPPPPPVHIPVGVPFPVPIPVIVTRKPTTTSTTTTTQAPGEGDGGDTKCAVAFALPFGFPMPFVMPQAPPPKFCADKARPKQCPPCPPCVCAPSCTPAFYSFCSPCHQKCRCKSNGDTPKPEPPRPPPPMPMLPVPMPMPAYPMAPAPGPIFIFPLPPAMPVRRPPRRVPIESRSTEVSSSSSETDYDSYSDGRRRRRRKHISKRTLRNHRKSARILETSDDTGTDEHDTKFVKPVLSYISKQGDVKFEKKISEDDAAHLMETDRSKSIEIIRSSRRSSNAGKVILKPMLSFISKQGDVKFEKKISEDDAAHLMETDKSKSNENFQKRWRASNDGENNKKPMISYISKQGKLKFETKISEDGAAHLQTDKSNSVENIGKSFRSAGKDSRTVIFSPPPNKKIANLTLSFNVVS